MSEQSGAGQGSAAQGGGGDPAFSNTVSRPAPAPPQGAERAIDRTRGTQFQDNPRSRGFRSTEPWQPQRRPPDGQQTGASADQQGQGAAADQQQHEGAAEPQTIRIGDVDYTADQVNEALRFKSENEIHKSGLPQNPDGYEVKLPADFKAPEGVNFQFDPNSAELKNFQRLAHARGLDQQTFSEALGIYAANRIGEQQTLGTARSAELSKLGSAATQRIGAIETWLKSQVGNKADLIVRQLRNFPVASMVEVFEHLARNASNQGSASYVQSGRYEEDNSGRIPGYEKMSFSERRAAQDAQAARRGGR